MSMYKPQQLNIKRNCFVELRLTRYLGDALKYKESLKYLNTCAKRSQVIFFNKKAQLSLTNPRDACEKFTQFT